MSAYVLTPAPFGSLCQSLTHPSDGPMQVATNVASVTLLPGIIAQVYVCPARVLQELLFATDSAGG